ncbi:MAG: AAA family ATPase [Alphaproteobacteria bacterium]|nr:AAA family ATPase [Alphaproteobacteria bacterium]
MRIEKVSIRGLRALKSRDDVLRSPGQDAPLRSVCLRGLNGAGKTTYLEAIAQLIQWFRRCTMKRGWATPSGTPLLREADLIALRLVDLPGPMSEGWLVWGVGEILRQFLERHPDAMVSWVDGEPRWRPSLLDDWDKRFALAELGEGKTAPNVVWIEAENKWVPELHDDELLRSSAGPAQPVVARYLPKARGPSHIEGVLGTLKLVREDRWAMLERWIPELLPGLSLAGFDEASRRPLFRITGLKRALTVDLLSAGERSVLINLALVARWLGPGGIVLLDEPELHQHLSLMRGSLAVLESFVAERGGQLLVASHAPEVWAHFRRPGSLIELEGRIP